MKKMWKIVSLLMPLFIAIAWLILVLSVNRTFTVAGGAQLAPVADIEPLVIGLSIFIIGYMLFMAMMFSEDIMNFFEERRMLLMAHKKTKKRK